MNDLARALADFGRLVPEMRDDMHAALQLFIDTNKSQFSRRTYLRTLFSQVEAFSYGMRRLLVAQEALHTTPLAPLERFALLEAGYDVTEQGEVAPRFDRFISPDRSLRLLFRSTVRCFGLTYSLPVSGRGWQAFRSALRVRNRITHPRAPDDLLVSDADIDDIQAAHTWFMESSQTLITKILRKLTGQDP